MAGFHFQGIIGIVLLDGREYRLANYLGAKVGKGTHTDARQTPGNAQPT